MTVTFTTPDPLGIMLTQCLQDLTDVLAATTAGAPEYLMIAPGGQVSWDCPTMAWVRLVRSYPSSEAEFPAPDANRNRRPPLRFAVDVEFGVLRCMPGVTGDVDNPVLPSAASLTAAALMLADDARALRALVHTCAYRKNILMGEFLPVGPDGNSAGGTVLLTLDVRDCAPTVSPL